MHLELLEKNVYGRVLVYPNCPKSKLLVMLTGKATFDQDDLVILKDLGYTVVITAAV